MKFKDKVTGLVFKPNNKQVLEMYKKNTKKYEQVNDSDSGMSYAELKALATELGLEFKSNIKKAELEQLIADNK